MKTITMSGYHEALQASLNTLSWVSFSGHYAEIKTQLTTPAVLVSVPSWQKAERHLSCGKMTVDLDVELYVVCDNSMTNESTGGQKPNAELFVRSAAADLTQWLDGNFFGLECVTPAAFVRAEREEFNPDMDDYVAFRLEFTQGVALGVDPFSPGEGEALHKVWLGVAPNIGAEHIDDYRPIFDSGGVRE